MTSPYNRIEIKQLLTDLKKGYDWMMKHENHPRMLELVDKAESKMKRLEELGIPSQDSSVFFYLGGSINHFDLDAFVRQYEEELQP